MAELLADFETYFISKQIASVVYQDTAPTDPDNLIAVYEYEGATPMPQIAGATRSIQFLVRDVSAVTARTKAKAIYKSLMTDDGILNLTPSRWCSIELRQPPFRLKVDESGRVYYVFNAYVTTYID